MAPFLKLTYTVDKIILCIIFNGLKKTYVPDNSFEWLEFRLTINTLCTKILWISYSLLLRLTEMVW